MATISAFAPTSSLARAAVVVHKRPLSVSSSSSSSVLGLPTLRGKMVGKVRCSMEEEEEEGSSCSKAGGMGASLIAAAVSAATMSMSSPAAMALVDERLSTEGTGLPFGLSSNLLGWSLLVVFALIWAFYFVYTSTLEEDEESGLSL